MSIVTNEDMNYLAQQSSDRLNLILSGMTALMNDTDSKVALLESQTWFQRMVKTLTGKNKLTQSEIQQNHDKINAYMAEAIAELFNRECIAQEVMMSLGTQLNEIYVEHIQLKQMMGAFVSKLNTKIDSVDNFHMLTTEINQGVYGDSVSVVSICRILSQFDNRILEDSRKLDIIRRCLVTQNIISDCQANLLDYLYEVIDIPIEMAGQIYLELSTIRGNFFANILLGMMENYHFLPDMARKMKNKQVLIEDVVNKEGIDAGITLASYEIYEDFVNSKIDVKNGLIPISDAQVDSKLDDAIDLFMCRKVDEAYQLFLTLYEKSNAKAGYYLYVYYTNNLKENCNLDNPLGYLNEGIEEKDIVSMLAYANTLPIDERMPYLKEGDITIAELRNSENSFILYEVANILYSIDALDGKQYTDILTKAYNNGNWLAAHKIAEWYYEKEQYDEAIIWLERDEILEERELLFRKAECCRKGTEKDVERAIELYERAANKEHSMAQYNLAWLYHFDEQKKNERESRKWLERAMDNGCKQAKLDYDKWFVDKEIIQRERLSQILLLPEGTSKEISYKINQLLILKAENSDIDCDTYVNELKDSLSVIEKKNAEEMNQKKILDEASTNKKDIDVALENNALSYVWKKIDEGNIYAEYAMEKYYDQECKHAIDVFDLSEFETKAHDLVKKSEKGNLSASYICTSLLYNMYSRDRRNISEAGKAAELILRLAEKGNISAITKKGFWGTHGYNNATSSKMEGIKYLQIGVEKKHPTALAWLGSYYRTGDIVGTRDLAKAREYLELAALYGQPYGVKELSKLNSGSTSSSSCYITSAVCGSFGKDDDCEELVAFRQFRDSWLRKQPDGELLIQEYYECAPQIVHKIDSLNDSSGIYKKIWDDYLKGCLKYIADKEYEKCKELYVQMVRSLRSTWL